MHNDEKVCVRKNRTGILKHARYLYFFCHSLALDNKVSLLDWLVIFEMIDTWGVIRRFVRVVKTTGELAMVLKGAGEEVEILEAAGEEMKGPREAVEGAMEEDGGAGDEVEILEAAGEDFKDAGKEVKAVESAGVEVDIS